MAAAYLAARLNLPGAFAGAGQPSSRPAPGRGGQRRRTAEGGGGENGENGDEEWESGVQKVGHPGLYIRQPSSSGRPGCH